MTVVIDDVVVQHELWRRIYAEYLEMPGLRLTLPQACRLWNTNLEVGQHVLDGLVEKAFLRRRGAHYVRSDAGGS